VATVFVSLAATLVYVLLEYRTQADHDARWIDAKYNQLGYGMSAPEVRQLLGNPGDHRLDPQKSYQWAYPLTPFSSPQPPKDPTIVPSSGGEVSAIWHWDYGSIFVYYSQDDPPRLLRKRFSPADGPRPEIERMLDPLRPVVYKHFNRSQYNHAWTALLAFCAVAFCAIVAFLRFRRKTKKK